MTTTEAPISRWGAALCAVALTLASPNLLAAPRARFEPTDLEMEKPGFLDIDLQVGTMRGAPSRPWLVDFEVDLGLAHNFELNVDGTFFSAIDENGVQQRHVAPFWVASKFTFFEVKDSAGVWATGAQIGPRIPTTRGPRGLGYEALFLASRIVGATQVVLNLGGLYDPPNSDTPRRSSGIEIGLDVVRKLGSSNFAVLAELATIRALSNDPHQLYVTLGVTRAFGPDLDVHVMTLFGLLGTGDRLGLLLGISQRVRLFEP